MLINFSIFSTKTVSVDIFSDKYFMRYSDASGNPTLSSGYQSSAFNKEIFSLPFDFEINIPEATNVLYNVFYFDSNKEFQTASGWKGIAHKPYNLVIPKNTNIKILFKHNESKIAELENGISTLLSYFTFTVVTWQNYDNQIDEINNRIYNIENPQANFSFDTVATPYYYEFELEQGSWNSGAISKISNGSTTSVRVSTALQYDPNYGIYVHCPSNILITYTLFREDKTYVTRIASSKETAIKKHIVGYPEARLITISFRKYDNDYTTGTELELLAEDLQNEVEIVYDNNTIPWYYKEYMPNKLIDAEKFAFNYDLTFAFITDVHVGDNEFYSHYMLKELTSKTSVIPFMVFGGDLMTTQSKTESTYYNQFQKWFNLIDDINVPVYQVQGNHDYYATKFTEDSDTSNTGISHSFKQCIKKLKYKNPNGGAYYFIDYNNFRLVFLNAFDGADDDESFGGHFGYSSNQIQWLLNTALNGDVDNIIIFTHAPIFQNEFVTEAQIISANEPIRQICKAINNKTTYQTYDYSNSDMFIDCVITGHRHMDISYIEDSVLCITSTCDARYRNVTNGVNIHRAVGDLGEQAFDIFGIDLTNRRIDTLRFGYGFNRSFTF